jgi:hypothetical protein
MYYRFGKAFYFFSILLFIFILLYFYSALPETVGLGVNENGLVDKIWNKGTFFYGMVAAFVIFNGITLYPPKSLETKSNKKLYRIFPIGDSYRDYFLAWFYSFGGMLNLSLALLVFFIHAINNQDEISPSKFSFFFYLMPVVLLVWVIGFFVLLMGKFKQVQKGV